MAKATYSNLLCGVRVLAKDDKSFATVNKKGYDLISLMREKIENNENKLPKNKDFESIKCSGVLTNIEKLWNSLRVYYSTLDTSKKEKKSALQNIVALEQIICHSLGMDAREEGMMVSFTETITINQYDFFNSCFSYTTKKGKKTDTCTISTIVGVGSEEKVELSCTTLTQFKKNVLFGLTKALMNDATMYDITKVHNKTVSNLEKKHKKEEKNTVNENIQSEKVVSVADKFANMTDEEKAELKKLLLAM